MIAQPPAAPPATWQWPVSSRRVLQPFRAPESLFGPGHRGMDVAVEAAHEVRAVADGVVRFVGEVAGVPIVSIDHGRLRSTYQPVVASVRIGDHITAGASLGMVADTKGHCSVTCLHVGARLGDDYLDPLRLLSPRRAVLKPLRQAAIPRADAPG